MESSVPRGRQWGRVVSVLFALSLLALARARQQSEVGSDLLSLAEDIYTDGPLSVARVKVAKNKTDPPLSLLIAAPETPGEYPVVQFQHGFDLDNYEYYDLLKHVASYGFIAVAPQIPKSINLNINAIGEIRAAASVINWLKPGLAKTLAKHLQSVNPDLDKVAVVGHSRGGKVVFGLATGVCETTLKISAIVGLDPVDGTTKPPILHYSPNDLKLGMPALIVGGGLSSQPRPCDFPCELPCFIPFPPCGPLKSSHQQFFNETDAPAFHFVAVNNGHMDYLNGECPDISTCCLCTNGPGKKAREHMRNFSAGITVAFLKAYLNKEVSPFCDAIAHISTAPVTLANPEIHGDLPPGCHAAQEA